MSLITALNHSKLFKTTVFNLILVLIFTIATPVYSQDTGVQLLKDGIKMYEEGKLDQAIIKLSSCVERGDLSKNQLIDAYKYLAQAYMARDLRDQAKHAIERLLKMMPSYKPDQIQDRPQYIELVETVRKEQQEQQEQQIVDTTTTVIPAEQKNKTTKWILVGAVVVVGVVVAIVLLPANGKDEELPAPPALPAR